MCWIDIKPSEPPSQIINHLNLVGSIIPSKPSTITELTEHSSTATELLSRGANFLIFLFQRCQLCPNLCHPLSNITEHESSTSKPNFQERKLQPVRKRQARRQHCALLIQTKVGFSFFYSFFKIICLKHCVHCALFIQTMVLIFLLLLK